MAFLIKRKPRKNWYIGIYMRNSKTKRYISTGTTNLSKARQVLMQMQSIETLHKSQNQLLSNLFKDEFGDRAMSLEMDGALEINPAMTLKTAAERFLKSRVNEITTGTLKSYALALKDLQGALNPKTPVKSLKRADYDKLVAFLVGRYNTTTVNIRLRGIRTFISWLLEFEFLEKKPFKIKQLKNEKLPKFLSPSEITGIYRHVTDPVIRSAFRVYQFTGIRLSELFSSELDGNYLRVRGKGNKVRFVPLPEEVREDFLIAVAGGYSHHTITHHFTDCWRKSLLERHPEKLPETGLNGLTKNRIRELVFEILEEEYCKSHNKDQLSELELREARSDVKTLHSFRHTFAVRTWLKTSDIYAVKKLLGHSAISVTEVYMRFPTEYLKEIFTT